MRAIGTLRWGAVVGAVLLACLAWGQTRAGGTAEVAPAEGNRRGVAEVGIIADLTGRETSDLVSLRIVGSKDRELLRGIAQELGREFGVADGQLAILTPGPEATKLIEDPGVGLYVRLPAVPRDGLGILPYAPFFTAFAPHVAKLRMVYIIRGPYEYRGLVKLEEPGLLTYTVDPPEISPAVNGQAQLSLYGVNAELIATDLSESGDEAPREGAPSKPQGRPPWTLPAALAGAALVGVLLAMVLSKVLLPRLKKWAEEKQPKSGGEEK